uniref:Uncharacterized protein n=1 Tax=Oryza brachyantha TaxID=4533 RepID=J3KW18_ORYBR
MCICCIDVHLTAKFQVIQFQPCCFPACVEEECLLGSLLWIKRLISGSPPQVSCRHAS